MPIYRNAKGVHGQRKVGNPWFRSSIDWLHNSDPYASLVISILWVCNDKLGNFNCHEGKRACESAHGDILSV